MTALPTVLPLIGLEGITLAHGGHKTREDGVCLLEAVAWLAGEPHSDHPACACPIMAAFGRKLNDRIRDNGERTALLRPIVALLVGSKSTADVERKRAYLAVDWAIREITPQWLKLVPALVLHAMAIRALSPITDKATAETALPVVRAARAYAAAAAAYATADYAAAADAAYAAADYAAYADAAAAYADAAAAADAAYAAYADAAADADAAAAAAYATADYAAAAAAAYAGAKPKLAALRDAQLLSAVNLLRRMAAITE